MKIITLTTENVKRLKAVQIIPSGSLICIGGNNGNGKSSVLDSIAYALGGQGEVPAVPVRRGEAKATIVADLGDIVVKRTFTAAGGTTLTVSNADGSKHASPQAILDRLTGKLAFDPLAFTLMDAKAQKKALLNIVKLDFTQMDAERETAYSQRTVWNNQASAAAQRVLNAKARKHHEDVAPVSTAELLKELENAKAHNAGAAKLSQAILSAKQARSTVEGQIETEEGIVADLKAKLASAENRLTIARNALPVRDGEVDAANAAHAAFVPIDEAPISSKISGASDMNQKVSENAARATEIKSAEAEQKDKQGRADFCTKSIKDIDTKKETALAEAKFPVAGLSFDENGVTFNGLPFGQSSAAEQLRVSVAMAAALNPKLRVMLVRDGSLMDDKSLALLGKLAEEHNLQVWVERVGKGAECSVIIEDGAVEPQRYAQEKITEPTKQPALAGIDEDNL